MKCTWPDCDCAPQSEDVAAIVCPKWIVKTYSGKPDPDPFNGEDYDEMDMP